MDYGGILKRAWDVTWNHKILWLFGLFAGAAGGLSGSNPTSGFNSSTNNPFAGQTPQLAAAQLQALVALLVVVGVVLFVVAIAWFILSIAARGGIVYLVGEADESREVRGGSGWRVGFSRWGRVFMVGFLAALPAIAIIVVMGVAIGLAVAGGIAAAASGGAGGGNTLAAVTGAIAGLCVVLVILAIALAVVAVIFGIVATLAINYAVLEDRHIIDSLKQGWRDLWGKRGAFVMFLVMLLVSIVVGIVLGIVSLVLLAPGIIAIVAKQWAAGIVLILIAALVLLLPRAIWAAYYNSAWTIFFRRMTGHGATLAPAMAGGSGAAPVSTSLPQPPAPMSPPPTPSAPAAPPSPPVPPVPPVPPSPPATGA